MCLMLVVVVTFLLVSLAVALGLLIARGALSLLFLLLGIAHPFIIRWHLVAFGTMLFWSWYFAPSLSAI
jgi:hypothetical protein